MSEFNRNMPELLEIKLIKLMMSNKKKASVKVDNRSISYRLGIVEGSILHCKHRGLDPWIVTSISNTDMEIERTSNDYLPVKDKFLGEADIKKAEDDLREAGISKGKCYIDTQGVFYEFVGCTIKEVSDYEHTNNTVKNPWRENVLMDVIIYNFKTETISYNSVVDWNDGVELNDSKWFSTIGDIDKLQLLEIGEGSKAFIERIQSITKNGIDSFKETIMIGESDQSEQSTELVGIASKEHMIQLREVAEEKHKLATILNRGVRRQSSIERRKMEIEVKKMMAEVEKVQDFVNKQLAVLDKKIKQLNKLIVTIELYAGISEHLVQVIEGEPSSEKTVHIRQKTVYLDEEMAVYEEQGLGWGDVTDFDKWLLESGAYKDILPEEKCVVAARVRRQNKKFSWIENPWIRLMSEASTNKTMLLFRNGDNVYRIWSDHLSYTDRLFPRKSELEENFKTIQEYYKTLEESDSDYQKEKASESIEKEEDKLFPYKKNILMLHGVFTRSDIFGEIPVGVSIMKPDTYGDHIKYVNDDEMMLDGGTRKFKDWLLEINSHIVHGSRIYLANEILSEYGGSSANDWDDRYTIYWYNEHARPSLPASGVYSVKRLKGEERVENAEEVVFSKLLNVDLDDPDIIDIKKSHRKSSEDGDNEWIYKIRRKYKDGSHSKREVRESLRITFDQNNQIQKENRYEMDGVVKHGKGTNFTSFKIMPEYDRFIINLDRVTIEDLEYFINDKTQREDYLNMMPILIGLKRSLMQEMNNEKEFADGMAYRINGELGLDDIKLVTTEVHKSIDWYKNKLATVIKRPLHVEGKDAKKAWGLVELNTKRSLKKIKKLKIDVSGIERGTFVYSNTHWVRYNSNFSWDIVKIKVIVHGSRSQAVNKIFEFINQEKANHNISLIGRNDADTITKAMIKRKMVLNKELKGDIHPKMTINEI